MFICDECGKLFKNGKTLKKHKTAYCWKRKEEKRQNRSHTARYFINFYCGLSEAHDKEYKTEEGNIDFLGSGIYRVRT